MRNNGMATLKDVAEKAGVSKMAVSVVMNGARSATRVSETTRQRILQAAEELSYHPNAVAQALVRRYNNIIGFYSAQVDIDIRQPFFAHIFGGILEGANECERDFLIHGTFRRKSTEEIYREMGNGHIDGLIIFPIPNDPLNDLLAKSRLPVITVSEDIENLTSVVVDDVQGGRLQAEFLITTGHKRIVYWHSDFPLISAQRRLDSFKEYMRNKDADIIYLQCKDTNDIKNIMSSPANERPTAIVTWNDMSGYSALDGCISIGLKVPEDVTIIGYDGFPNIYEPRYKITTIRAPYTEAAKTAARLIIDKIKGAEIPQKTVLPVELQLGNTHR